MPAGLDQRRAASLSEGLRGLWDMGAGALKGGVQGIAGMPGDLEQLVRELRGSSGARILPTTEEVAGYLPSTGTDTKTFEKLGENINPLEELKVPLAAAKGAIPLKAVVGATTLAAGLRAGKGMKVEHGRLNSLLPITGNESRDVLDRAQQAEQILRQGGTPEDVWKMTGVHPIQRPPDDPGMAPRASFESKFSREIVNPADKPLINPDVLMSEKETEDFLHKNIHPIQLQSRTADEIVQALRADKPQIIRPGEYNYEDVIPNHPILGEMPELRKRGLQIFQTTSGNSLGSSLGDKEVIHKLASVHQKVPGQRLGTSKYEDTILHELQHYIQRERGAPTGGSSSGLKIPSNIDEGHLEYQLAKLPKELQPFGLRMDKNIGMNVSSHRPEFDRYKNIYGEQEARAAALREVGPRSGLKTAPYATLDNPSGGTLPGEFQKMLGAYTEAQSTMPSNEAAFTRAFAAALRARGLR